MAQRNKYNLPYSERQSSEKLSPVLEEFDQEGVIKDSINTAGKKICKTREIWINLFFLANILSKRS